MFYPWKMKILQWAMSRRGKEEYETNIEGIPNIKNPINAVKKSHTSHLSMIKERMFPTASSEI